MMDIADEIEKEMYHQRRKHGSDSIGSASNSSYVRLSILQSEVYEVRDASTIAELREELLQVAACAVAWMKALDKASLCKSIDCCP